MTLTPFGEKAAAVVKAWRRIGQCEDEFGPDSPACGEWRDALDDAILALEEALRPGVDVLVARGMEVVNRVIEATGPCAKNEYGERHCYHWRGQPPTLRTRVQADCCWCGVTRTFDYVDVMEGNAPISVRPSGSVHGTARDWLEQPTTHALGRLSAKGAARDHAQKMADAASGGAAVTRSVLAENPPLAISERDAQIPTRWTDTRGEA